MEKGLQKRKELIFKIALCAIMAALAIALDKVSVSPPSKKFNKPIRTREKLISEYCSIPKYRK